MAAASGLISTGCEVIDIGIAPTPTVGLAVSDLKAKGAITVTASHNPIEWNALKFFNQKGRYLSPPEIDVIKGLVQKKRFRYQGWHNLGKIRPDSSQIKKHIHKILGLELVQSRRIKKTGFRVVIDACNGAGYEAAPELLKALGCSIVKINCENTGAFPRGPEPVAKNLKELEKAVQNSKADIGFALDPDADRLAIVSECGQAIGEEYTLALAVDYVLKHKPGKVAVNLSTSRMIDEIARGHSCSVVRTKVGEANVSAKLEQINGIIGGEGNGGVILPELHYTRDGLLGMALVLSYLAERGKTVGTLAKDIPKFYMIKKVLEADDRFGTRLIGLTSEFDGARVLTQDGIRFDFPDRWLHLRKSNTEPVVRIIAEATTEKAAFDLVQKALKALG